MRLKCAATGSWKQRVTPVSAKDAGPLSSMTSQQLWKREVLKKYSKMVLGRGKRGSSLAYKTGDERQGRTGQGAEKIKEGGQSLRGIPVQS